ncbi:hypothetical protein LSTR_LSTR000075 [Laodelphax striatellus]|uniref:Mitochondrial potassium channel ATP-binding subunit n=1 Tax=Laodelphax striatellus TaxID=195883 RepID=A0A482X7T4_LAOST|nr:hypothetical protein LSTR_LSTR000075 [Laodelphax striatellus]
MLWRFVCNASYRTKFCNVRKLLNQFSKDVRLVNFSNNVKAKPSECTNGLRLTRRPVLQICVVAFTGIGVRSLVGLSKVECAGVRYIEKKKSSDAKFIWSQFFKLLWPEIWCLLIAVGAAIIVAVLNVHLPIYLGGLINVMTRFLKDNEAVDYVAEMKGPVFRLISLYLIQSVATFVYISVLSGVGERIAASMKKEVFASIMRQELSFFDMERTGELIDCLTTDVQEFKSAFKLCVSQGLRSLTQIGGCIVSLYFISPKMTGMMVVVVPAIIVIGTTLGAILRSISKEAQKQAARAITIGEEAISNIRTVRAFANEDKECEIFGDEVDESSRLHEKLGFGIGLFQAGTNLFLNGIVLGTLYCGGYLIVSEQMTAGDLMSFLVATQTIQRSMAQMSLLFGHFIKGHQSGARIFQLINQESSIPISGGSTIPYHSLIANVEFKDVSFSYPTRPEQVILKNFNLSLPAGKTVAIVGTSGNGKSTVAALLERFYDVDQGCITVAGVDIRKLDPKWLRGKVIGLINQEPVLFATSIMENIRYGKPSATDEEVYEAAKKANADGFISKFPQGYNTVVGERGITVSGGQKQRIAIARALLKNPSILILDEATSALDAESEKVVQKALDEVSKMKTVLVIAHRLSTIQNADLIVVLKNGVIVEKGNHGELMVKKGHYWNLMNQQDDQRTKG